MKEIAHRFISLLFLTIGLFTLHACCTKVYCVGANDLNEIRFYNFKPAEIDTIVVKRFTKNSDFKLFIDSTVVISDYVNGTDFQIVSLTENLQIDFDYKIALLSQKETYTVSDFVTRQESCNSGFLCNDSYLALKNYKVNGKVVNGALLEINK